MIEGAAEKPMTPLEMFFYKTLTVVGVVMVALSLGSWYVTSTVQDLLATPGLKGGHVFWTMVENQIIKLADKDDLPPEEKEKIVKALGKLSGKYHPYLEALFPEVSAPPETKQLAAGKSDLIAVPSKRD